MSKSVASIAFDAHPELEAVARSGTAGDIVEAVEPHTEADPAAVLANLLVWFGSAVGPEPHMRAGDARHSGRLFAVVVGETSVSRKGTARAAIDRLLVPRTHHLAGPLVNQVRGLGSGEGLIQAVADLRPQPDVGRSVLVVADEFARVLTVMGRRGSTLSAILREAWDSERLEVTTRKDRLVVSGAHVSVVAEITAEELAHMMPTIHMMNGFGNRFLWVLARRSRHLPDGGGVPKPTATHMAALLRTRAMDARRLGRRIADGEPGELRRTDAGAARWREVYKEVSIPRTGIEGAAMGRAEAQILRLSIVYALLDGSTVIDVPHIEAAYGFWRYCEKSASLIFANRTLDSAAAKIESVVERAGPLGITRTELQKEVSNHLDQRRLTKLIESGRVVERKLEAATGRPPTVLVHANHAVEAK